MPLTTKQINKALAVMFLFFPFIAMSIDIVAPSLPAISKSLNTSAHYSKNLITLYLIGYAAGTFFLGFISDAIGRKKILISGL